MKQNTSSIHDPKENEVSLSNLNKSYGLFTAVTVISSLAVNLFVCSKEGLTTHKKKQQ